VALDGRNVLALQQLRHRFPVPESLVPESLVVRLVRTAIGSLTAPTLLPGTWRDLRPVDIKRLDA
jgi:hypothetical protein